MRSSKQIFARLEHLFELSRLAEIISKWSQLDNFLALGANWFLPWENLQVSSVINRVNGQSQSLKTPQRNTRSEALVL